MQRVLTSRRARFGAIITAGIGAVAAAVGGAALMAGVAAAQTPPSPPSPSAMRLPLACDGHVAVEAVVVMRADLAAQLAKALGKPQAEVERALRQAESQLPPPQPLGSEIAVHIAGESDLAAIAARLGVTAAELSGAMRAVEPPCPPVAPAGQPGGTFDVLVEPDGLFVAVAQKLGRGIAAAQVKAAFDAERGQAAGLPDQIVVRGVSMDEHLATLAAALDVTQEQLKAALQSIAPVLPAPRPAGR